MSLNFDIFRDPIVAKNNFEKIKAATKNSWNIMEVCGGQTRTIVKYGLQKSLPSSIELIHGPGCPVCVTPIDILDKAHKIAMEKDVIFCSYGDMLRVPGSFTDLLQQKAKGADVRTIYSPMETLTIAEKNPNKIIVLFALGFETTAPANAMAIAMAKKKNLKNFKALVSHVLVPPAIEAIANSSDNRVNAFLGPGHVCSVVGAEDYKQLCEKYKMPIIITGFEPNDILEGIFLAIKQLEKGEYKVENQYARVVGEQGNLASMEIINSVFEVSDRNWRGIGTIPLSGYQLNQEYSDYNAEIYFEMEQTPFVIETDCISGEILKGNKKPKDCPHFAKKCTPEHPLGATMVSTEGACASYYQFD